MKMLLPALAALSLSGCMTLDDWSEAPGNERYGYDDGYDQGYGAVPWWGSNATSVDLFYGPLSGYGRWDRHPRYGRVFLPGGIGSGWQPYSRGHWSNDRRYGRRWVSSEPFGWATYHYGRWGRDPRLGWFWVPDTRFGGSWVDWRDDRGYASWAPLPPIGWDRYAYGNDWWLSAPSAYLWRPGLNRHVRPGRPQYWHDRQDRPDRVDRPNGHDRPVAEAPRPPRVGGEPGQWGRTPRSDPDRQGAPTWQRGERQGSGQGWRGGERPPNRVPGSGGWQGGERPADALGRAERTDAVRAARDLNRAARAERAPQVSPSGQISRPAAEARPAPQPATVRAERGQSTSSRGDARPARDGSPRVRPDLPQLQER